MSIQPEYVHFVHAILAMRLLCYTSEIYWQWQALQVVGYSFVLQRELFYVTAGHGCLIVRVRFQKCDSGLHAGW